MIDERHYLRENCRRVVKLCGVEWHEVFLPKTNRGRLARNRAMFEAYKDTELSALVIGGYFGLTKADSAAKAILAHAKRIDHPARRLSEIRCEGGRIVDWTALAFRLAGWREERGWTQKYAADHVGISQASWRRAEDGQPLDGDTFAALLDAAPFSREDILTPEFRERRVSRVADTEQKSISV